MASPGDVDGDDSITLFDAALTLEIAAGITEADEFTSVDGDVASDSGNTPDGKVTLVDAVRIARAANGLDDEIGNPPGGAIAALPKMDNVTFAGNFTKNYKLDPSYKVQGTVTTTTGQPITSTEITATSVRTIQGTISFQHATNFMAYGSDSPEDGTTDFTVFTDRGTNNVTIHSDVTEFNITNGSMQRYSVVQDASPATLNVTGDMTGVAFVRPNLPAPGMVQGNITGTNFTPTSAFFALDAGSYAQATLNGSAYSVLSGPGNGSMTVYGNLTGDNSVSVMADLNGTPIVVNPGGMTLKDLAVPTLATLTGTVTAPGGLKVTSASIGQFSQGVDYFNSSYGMDATAQTYKLAIPPGTYPLMLSLPQTTHPASTLNLSYSVSATLNAGANTKNVTLPALPANVTFSGVVTGPDNAPLPGASVSATGSHTSGYLATAYGTTNASGAFSLTLPAGTYSVFINPPTD